MVKFRFTSLYSNQQIDLDLCLTGSRVPGYILMGRGEGHALRSGGDQLVSDVQGQSELLFLSFSMLFIVVSVK